MTKAPAGLAARAVAADALAAILDRRRPLEEAFAAAPGYGALEARDRAFARLLLATTLRRLGQIDAMIKHCLERPLPRAARMAQHILRLGAAQLMFLGTPAHAAVSAAVDHADAAKLTAHKKLINAVLRRIAREGEELRDAQDEARLNTPAWLWDSWVGAYGEATARAIATAHLAEPPLDITLMPDEPANEWAERLEAALLPSGSLRRAANLSGAIADLPGYAEGRWWVQDAAATLPAKLLLSALARTDAPRIADLCAAPGGKTAQLAAALAPRAAARLIALDIGAGRLVRLRENLARLKLTAEIVQGDAGEWRPDTPLDGILLDAPCSATGTIRRHPDILRAKRPDDVAKLGPVQDRLLAHALSLLKPGGVLVYAVCSLEPAEGPERIAALLRADPALERLPVAPAEIGGLDALITKKGDLRTLPSQSADPARPALGGFDGFYAARLRKTA
ncbi:MAG: RsmB/NOP family class I SAM-dependent RNA methyltransferase [Alphaproteobacteria bacterium]